MKASVFAVGSTAVVVLVSALAETRPFTGVHPESLARFEAISSYCEKADPSFGSEYAAKLARFTRGQSEGQLQQDRNSVKYRDAMAQANSVLLNATTSTGLKGCTTFLALP